MLNQIIIKNLLSIHALTLDVAPHTTVLTGETGTGKSMLIDAIELALGARASEQLITPGQDKSEISLCFDVSKMPSAIAWLKEYDLWQETAECLIRRTIHRDGRTRSYINDMPTTLQPLRELADLLMDIHGQHEHQSILKSEKQREMLDDFGNHFSLTQEVSHLAENIRTLHQEIHTLQKLTEERSAKSEFLNFQLRELEALHILPHEFETLDLEHKQLAHADELLKNLHGTLACLTENEESNALGLLNQALQSLETVQNVNPKISQWVESLKTAIIEISETESDLHRYLDSVERDPERLDWVEKRIGVLFDIARKYKISPNELDVFQENLALGLKTLENSDERLNDLTTELKNIEKKYTDTAKKLSEHRLKAGQKLENEITRTIQELALPDADFRVMFEENVRPDFSPHGLEKISFHVSTQKGQPAQPLAKVASGGELSRIGLALYLATAGQHPVSTLIFDEVDTGISGSTAEIVGRLLRRLGKTHQVLCVTHLPQVASQGHHHIRVVKTSHETLTTTTIETLTPSEKITEIARMLGGVAMTQKTLEHAREMVESVE